MSDDKFWKKQEAELEQQKSLRAQVEQQSKVSGSKEDAARANKAWRKALDAKAAAEAKNPILGRMARAATIAVTASLGAVLRLIPGGRRASNVLFVTAGAAAYQSHRKAKAARPAIRQANIDTNAAARATAEANQSQGKANIAMQQAEDAKLKAQNAMVLARNSLVKG